MGDREYVCIFPDKTNNSAAVDTRTFEVDEPVCVKPLNNGPYLEAQYVAPSNNPHNHGKMHKVKYRNGQVLSIAFYRIGKKHMSASPTAVNKVAKGIVTQDGRTLELPPNVANVVKGYGGGRTKKQKGGYYFAIYDGVRAAGMLMPLALRQGWSLMNSNTNKSRSKSKSKNKNHRNQRKTRRKIRH